MNNPRVGQCYTLSWDWVSHGANSGWTLVHGVIRHPHPKPGLYDEVDHAWVEIDTHVHDPVMDLFVPRDAYYRVFDAKATKRYTASEAIEQGMLSGHAGPWHRTIEPVRRGAKKKGRRK